MQRFPEHAAMNHHTLERPIRERERESAGRHKLFPLGPSISIVMFFLRIGTFHFRGVPCNLSGHNRNGDWCWKTKRLYSTWRHVYNSTMCMTGTQEDGGESESLGTVVTDGWKLSCGSRGLDLEEEQVPLAIEPSFQPQP